MFFDLFYSRTNISVFLKDIYIYFYGTESYIRMVIHQGYKPNWEKVQ